MTTPESGIKRKVSALLKAHKVYYLMPVQQGIGAAGVDYHCVKEVQGFPLAFFVETKAFGKHLTPRQNDFVNERREHQKAKTFVVDCSIDLKGLEQWLIKLERYGLMSLIPDWLPASQAYSERIKSLSKVME